MYVNMHRGQIFNAMVAFFEDDDWNFHWVDGMPVLSMSFTGKNGKWLCYAQAREDQEQFVYYSVCPVNVPEERRNAAAEFITRANYGMIIGNFEMDYKDGEIRYKTSIDVEGAELTPPLVKQMVYANVIIMDRYLPGIMRVIYGDASPETEIAKIEAGEDFPFSREELNSLLADDDFDEDFDDEGDDDIVFGEDDVDDDDDDDFDDDDDDDLEDYFPDVDNLNLN